MKGKRKRKLKEKRGMLYLPIKHSKYVTISTALMFSIDKGENIWSAEGNISNKLSFMNKNDSLEKKKNELMVDGKKGECRTVGKSCIHCCI